MKKFSLIMIVLLLFIVSYIALNREKPLKKENIKEEIKIEYIGKNIEELKEFAEKNNYELDIQEEFNKEKKNIIISHKIENNKITVKVSKGIDYETLRVNELGNIPIMMYHGIVNTTENKYTGGNVDKDGYNRTSTAFKKDLEFYYNNNYRMIRLTDYVDGVIKTEAGFSPIVLTFDDGLQNNINVTGLDEKGNIIIDPNSAVGILEEFKKKYPDFNVTATFFVNQGLFNQTEYNDKILKWMVDNGYDIGNHTMTHANLQNIEKSRIKEEILGVYNILDKSIKDKYVNILALPFGTPYNKNHSNFQEILNSHVKATLRVGWESEVSPFSTNFDKTHLKRIRAYDNNSKDFDIEMNFKILETNRFISDGYEDIITIRTNCNINNPNNLEIFTY